MTALWLSLQWPCLQLDYAEYLAGSACPVDPCTLNGTTLATDIFPSPNTIEQPSVQVQEGLSRYGASSRLTAQQPISQPISNGQSSAVSLQWPVVLLDESSMQVVEMDRRAAAAGISHGMSLALCCALVANLQVQPYQATRSAQLCQLLAEPLHSVCADLYLGPDHSLLLRLDPMLQLHHGVMGCLQAVQSVLAPLRLRCVAGLANSWVLAQLAQQPVEMQTCGDFQPKSPITPTPHLAKRTQKTSRMQASNHTSPASRLLDLCALPQQTVATLQVALSDTPLPAKFIEQLQRLGISTLAGLLALPLKELSRRFPRELLQFIQQLDDTSARGLIAFLPSDTFDVQVEFVWQPTLWTQLIRPVAGLLQQFELFLTKRQLHAHHLEIRLELQEHDEVRLQIHAAAGEYQQAQWLKLTSQKLEVLQLPSAVRRLRLQAHQLQARPQKNHALWQEQKNLNTHQTSAQLLALLQARLGAGAITQATAPTGHHIQLDVRPELDWASLEWRSNPLAEPSAASALITGSVLPYRWSCRPLFLYSQPQPLPSGYRKLSGIERLCSPWWQGTIEQRDYFIAQSPLGQWHWCFKDAFGQFFSHGGFA